MSAPSEWLFVVNPEMMTVYKDGELLFLLPPPDYHLYKACSFVFNGTEEEALLYSDDNVQLVETL